MELSISEYAPLRGFTYGKIVSDTFIPCQVTHDLWRVLLVSRLLVHKAYNTGQG